MVGFAVKNASQHIEGCQVSITSRESAVNATPYLLSTNTVSEKTVLSVHQRKSEDVYCLTVNGAGCFVLANGAIASNCDANGYLISYKFPVNKPTTHVQRMIV